MFKTSNNNYSAQLLKNLVDDPDLVGQMPSDEEKDSGDPHMENNNHEEEDQPQPQQTQPQPQQDNDANLCMLWRFAGGLICS